MKYDLLIKNGVIVSPSESLQANIAVKNGKIAAIGNEEFPAGEVVDARGQFVLPGVIDIHVHYREPGMTERDDFYHGSRASAIGGCTTVFDMPNTLPPVDTAEHFAFKKQCIAGKSFVDYCLWGIIIGNDISHIGELAECGIIAYKIFLGNSGGPFASPEEGALFEAFRQIEKTGLRVCVHAEDRGFSEYYEKKFELEGRNDYMDFDTARSNVSEALAVSRMAALAHFSGCKIHILHTSAKESVAIGSIARSNGIEMTLETCPQYLHFTKEDRLRFGSQLKAQPPVRTKEDNEAMLQGLRDGAIQIVCSDTAPHEKEKKMSDGPVWQIPSGIDISENMVSMMLDLVNAGKLTLSQYVRAACENPARMFGIYPKKGAIRIGSDADFTIVDMDKKVEVRAETSHYKQPFNLLDGCAFRGAPVYTILRGRVIAKDGEIVGEPGGEYFDRRDVAAAR